MNPEAPVFQPEKNFDKCNTIKVVSTLNVHHNANIKVDPQSKWLSLVDVTYHFPQATELYYLMVEEQSGRKNLVGVQKFITTNMSQDRSQIWFKLPPLHDNLVFFVSELVSRPLQDQLSSLSGLRREVEQVSGTVAECLQQLASLRDRLDGDIGQLFGRHGDTGADQDQQLCGHDSSRTDSAFSSDMSYSDADNFAESEHQLNPEAKAFEPIIEMKDVNSNQVSDLETHENIELWREKSMGDGREELKCVSSYKMMAKEELEKITFRPKLRK